MIAGDSPFPPGQVLVVSADLARYPEFSQSLLRLYVPIGSTWEWASGTSIEANRNLAVSRLKPEQKWVYTIDDDHSFKPETLMRLLQRMYDSDGAIDILQGLCLTRKPPYLPYAYMRDMTYYDWGVRYVNATLDELPTSGVSEWDACGTGGMLIRREVLDAMKYPWFESGKTFKDAIGEDLYFCTKAKDLGFRVWVDSDVRTGHITKATCWPAINDGKWHLGLEMGNQVNLVVPREAWADAKFDEIKIPVQNS